MHLAISGLPLEVLTIISRYLGIYYYGRTKHFKQYALVCRNWNFAVRPFMFSNIYVTSPKNLGRLFVTALQDKELGRYVKILRIGIYDKMDGTSLYLVAKLFVNLERLYFLPDVNSFYNLRSLFEEDRFSVLEEIPDPSDEGISEYGYTRDEEMYDVYYQCMKYTTRNISRNNRVSFDPTDSYY